MIDSGLQKVPRFDPETAAIDSLDARADLARLRRSARRPRRPHRGRGGAAAVGRADPASAARAGSAARRPGVAGARHPRVGRRSAHVRMVRAAARASHRSRRSSCCDVLAQRRTASITAVGRRLQRLPLHPRLGRLLLDGHGSFEAAAACAWLSEPSRFERGGQALTCDLLPIIDAWRRMPAPLQRVAESLQRAAGGLLDGEQRTHIDETVLRRALLAGYPDRVAKAAAGRRRPGHAGERARRRDRTRKAASSTESG